MSKRERVRIRNEKVIPFLKVTRIKITANRNIFIGYDDAGKRLYGRAGDVFSVPEDLSRESATKLLMSGFAEPADESGKAEKYIPEPARPKKLKLRVEPPIEMIKIVSAGIRSSEKAFFLGNSDGEGLSGKVGDKFNIKDGEMSEELALKLIKKGYAEKVKPGFLKKLIKKFD